MRWPWHRRAKRDDGAETARRDAECKLEEAVSRQDEITEVAEQLRKLRQRNRFAAMIEETMRLPPRPDGRR